MKIMQIDVNYKKGSTGKIVHDIHSTLTNKKIESFVLYGRGPIILEKNVFKFGIDLETAFHAFLTRITGLMGYFSPISTYRLIKTIKKHDPDVLHIHEIHSYFMNINKFLKFLSNFKGSIIWTFHCEFLYTGKCGYSYSCDKWKSNCGNCPLLRDYPKSYFFDFTRIMQHSKRKLLSNIDKISIVTPSNWLASRVKQSFLSIHNVSVINNGIDVENIFFPRNKELMKEKYNYKNKKIILSVAPNIMEERKGGKLFLELAKEYINDDTYHFIMIGVNNPLEIVQSNVTALKRTADQIMLAEYYSMANVFVICSSMENFPTTCLESMCCGTPVIGFDTGGTKETAQRYGQFVQYKNIQKLKDSLQSVIVFNEEKLREMSEFARTRYSKARMVDEYIDLYQKVRT